MSKKPSDRWYADAESRIYGEQYEEVKREYGKRAADRANYGWGVEDGDGYVRVSTKVYGRGVLSSTAIYRRGVEHEWGDL